MKNVTLNRIAELATQNFNQYPEDYPIENKLSTDEATMAAQDLAISYFENREDIEIERDEELNIDQSDYVDSVMSAFSDFIQENI